AGGIGGSNGPGGSGGSGGSAEPGGASRHPLRYDVDYDGGPRNRLTTLLRLFMLVPIVIVLTALSGAYEQTRTSPRGDQGDWHSSGSTWTTAGTIGGLLFLAPMLMILFRQKYPRWWFNWNLELMRFQNRITSYAALLRDDYPSTDERQAVHLDIPY